MTYTKETSCREQLLVPKPSQTTTVAYSDESGARNLSGDGAGASTTIPASKPIFSLSEPTYPVGLTGVLLPSDAQINNDSFLFAMIPPGEPGTDSEDIESDHDRTLLGMALRAAAGFCFCTVAVIVEYYNGSVTQLLIFRYVLQHVLGWAMWLKMRQIANSHNAPSDGWNWLYQSFDPRTLLWYGNSETRFYVWLRAGVYWVMIYTLWRGVELVAIGTADCILFLSPMLIVMFARVFLKEAIPVSFWICVIPAVISLVFVTQPEFIFDLFDNSGEYESVSALGVGFLILSTFAGASEAVLVRSSKGAHWLQLELVTSFLAGFILTPLLILLDWFISDDNLVQKIEGSNVWKFDTEFFLVGLATSVLGFLALMSYVIAYQVASATKIAFIMYLELVFAFAYQILLFGEVPNTYEIIGASLLVVMCLVQVGEQYCLHRRNSLEGYTQVSS